MNACLSQCSNLYRFAYSNKLFFLFFYSSLIFLIFVPIRFTYKLDPVAHTITIMISCLAVFLFFSTVFCFFVFATNTNPTFSITIWWLSFVRLKNYVDHECCTVIRVIMILIIVASHLFGIYICLTDIGNRRKLKRHTKQNVQPNKINQVLKNWKGSGFRQFDSFCIH